MVLRNSIVLGFAALLLTAAKPAPQPEESAQRWFSEGAQRADQLGAGQASAKNVILFVGDGMSLPTVAAARIYEGQLHKQTGEENLLSFEHFPQTAFSKTYNTETTGELIALFNSLDLLEIAIVKGYASELLSLTPSSTLRVSFVGK